MLYISQNGLILILTYDLCACVHVAFQISASECKIPGSEPLMPYGVFIQGRPKYLAREMQAETGRKIQAEKSAQTHLYNSKG